MRGFCSIVATALLLVSCRQGDSGDGAVVPPEPPAPDATASAAPPEVAPPPIVEGRGVSEENEDYLFEYSFPVTAAAIPELAAVLERRLEQARNELARESAGARKENRANGFPYNRNSTGTMWQVVTDTPDFLSLSAVMTSYSGGAHGNSGFDSLVWDKQRAVALAPADFFSSTGALEASLGNQLCEALASEQEKRRGAPSGEGVFDECVSLSEGTVLLGSSTGRAFDRIGVQFAPYVAGAYAEGPYEFTFYMDGKMLLAVREEYRSAFTTRN